jgi:hypothetical protein
MIKAKLSATEILTKDTSGMPPEEKARWERMRLWLTDWDEAHRQWKVESGFAESDCCRYCTKVVAPNETAGEWRCQLIVDTMRENGVSEKFAVVDADRDICNVYEQK